MLDEYDALGAIEFLRSAGLSVPQDSALARFDDIELVWAIQSFLTAVSQPARTFARLVCSSCSNDLAAAKLSRRAKLCSWRCVFRAGRPSRAQANIAQKPSTFDPNGKD